jgi:hypothetical protein
MDFGVENVLAGDLRPGLIEVLYFGFSSANSSGYSGPPLFRPSTGERRVLFLSRSANRLRLVGDVYDYTIRMASGDHSGLAMDGLERWDFMARLLLTLGAGYEEDAMVSNLPYYARLIDRFESRLIAANYLVRLSVASPTHVRVAACLHLAAEYPGQYGCLSRLLLDRQVPDELRRKLQAALEFRLKKNAILRSALKRNPLTALTSSPFPDSLNRVREEFLLLSDDPDGGIAGLACSALARFFPGERPRCRPPSLR